MFSLKMEKAKNGGRKVQTYFVLQNILVPLEATVWPQKLKRWNEFLILLIGIEITLCGSCTAAAERFVFHRRLKKNQNAPRPSEHPPVVRPPENSSWFDSTIVDSRTILVTTKYVLLWLCWVITGGCAW